ncbi:MAG: hypothetical protein DRQ10_03495 [Candidatus Hydrothermota bacterium]|nr:MAG: hypothetical protein DRQ10_03495 [Candidatus Hydrothermae bacterium]
MILKLSFLWLKPYAYFVNLKNMNEAIISQSKILVVFMFSIIVAYGFIFYILGFGKILSKMTDLFWLSFIAGIGIEAIFSLLMLKGGLGSYLHVKFSPFWTLILRGTVGYFVRIGTFAPILFFILMVRSSWKSALLGGVFGCGMGYENIFFYTLLAVGNYDSIPSLLTKWLLCKNIFYITSMALGSYAVLKAYQASRKSVDATIGLLGLVVFILSKFCSLKFSMLARLILSGLVLLVLVGFYKAVFDQADQLEVRLIKNRTGAKLLPWTLMTIAILEIIYILPMATLMFLAKP